MQSAWLFAVTSAGALAVCAAIAACGGPADERPSDAAADATGTEAFDGEIESGDSTRDTAVDAPTYASADYGAFQWRWVGTGSGKNFYMDRDCGIDAKEFYPGYDASGVGTVAAADCTGWKALATSKEVTAALATPGACGTCCDDYGTMELTLVDGGKLKKSVDGCGSKPPFHMLGIEMQRLARTYAFTDAGADASAAD